MTGTNVGMLIYLGYILRLKNFPVYYDNVNYGGSCYNSKTSNLSTYIKMNVCVCVELWNGWSSFKQTGYAYDLHYGKKYCGDKALPVVRNGVGRGEMKN